MSRVLEYIYYFFYASIVLGVLFHIGTIYPFKVALLFLAIYFVYFIISTRNIKYIKDKVKDTFTVSLFFYIFFIYYLFSYFWIEYDFILYKSYMANFLKSILLALILVYYIDNLEKLKKAILILSIFYMIEIAFGVMQLYPDVYMPNSKVNFPSTIPTGFSYNQNDFGYTLGLIFPFVLFLANRILKLLLGSAILVIIVKIGSIVALVSFVFSLLCYLIFVKKMYKTIFISIFILFLLFYSNVYKTILPPSIAGKISNFDKIITLFSPSENTPRTGSTLHKYQVNQIIFDSLKRTNYIGLGAGQSLKELEHNQDRLYEKNFSVHNFWMEVLADAGLFFTTIFFIYYLYMIFKTIKNYLQEEDSFLKNFLGALALSLMAFFISSLSPSSVFSINITWLLFGMFAVSVQIINKKKAVK